MFIGRENPEDIGLSLSQVKDSIPRRSHRCLGIDPLPAATPDCGLQEEWDRRSESPKDGREFRRMFMIPSPLSESQSS